MVNGKSFVRLLFFLWLITFVLPSYGQIHFSGEATGRHKKAIQHFKTTRNQAKALKRETSRKRKELRKLNRTSLTDSLQAVSQDSSWLEHQFETLDKQNRLARARNYKYLADSLQKIDQDDSIYYHKLRFYEALAKDSILQYYDIQLAKGPTYDSAYLSLLTSSMENWISEYAINGLPAEMEVEKTFFNDPGSFLPALPEIPTMKLPKEATAIAPDRFSELLQNKPEQTIKESVQKVTGLKRKYESLETSTDLSTGVKRNSLQGKPLVDRIHLGGNFIIQSTDPFILDSDVQLGYKINKKLIIGAGFRWRESFVKTDSIAGTVKDAHGYSGFANYDIAKGFFAYAEYAAILDQPIFRDVEVTGRWQYEHLVGIGRRFSVFKFMDMNVLFLFDFNHKNNNLHPRPFEVRIGYGITKLPIGHK